MTIERLELWSGCSLAFLQVLGSTPSDTLIPSLPSSHWIVTFVISSQFNMGWPMICQVRWNRTQLVISRTNMKLRKIKFCRFSWERQTLREERRMRERMWDGLRDIGTVLRKILKFCQVQMSYWKDILDSCINFLTCFPSVIAFPMKYTTVRNHEALKNVELSSRTIIAPRSSANINKKSSSSSGPVDIIKFL